MDNPPLLIGCAAGFSGDRIDAAGPVVDTLIARLETGPAGQRAFLIFETLAERTLALAQLRRRADPEAGYEPLLDAMLRPVLSRCLANGIRIVSNFGAANPRAAARLIARLARELGAEAPRIAVVEGDDLSSPEHLALLRERLGARMDGIRIVSANAYIGAEPIREALDAGAQIVVCGRVADPSLTVGPALSHFGWRSDDWERLGRATMAGHLLECGVQVCGGYFADPGYKDVPDLEAVGFPIAVIDADGGCTIGKADGTGGLVSEATVKEQLLYEVHDPSAYLTPDVVADISEAEVHALDHRDCVALRGVKGHPRPSHYKVNVCHEGGWLAEGEISYAGPRAEARAGLAADVLRKRLPALQLRVDLIGAVSVFGDDAGRTLAATADEGLRDVRLRVAAAHDDRAQAERLVREVVALYTCGPAGGGGVRTALTPRLSTLSCLLPREAVPVRHVFIEEVAQ
ncbi:acyclic terpene utilization AtuA family protein [Variovorax ureilyticus]|uniref:acyclic terpene utilization AtuA family protein n=1 Tax=Variovorax ureilyticus TaxID=1836198 RepID=UPI003D67333C